MYLLFELGLIFSNDKKRNPLAKDLKSPKYKMRVTRDKKKYSRKRDTDQD